MKKAKSEISGVISFEHGGNIFIQCHRNGHILGYDSVQVAMSDIETAYIRAMNDGRVSGMMVLLGSLFFRVKIHAIKDQNWLRGNVISVPYSVVRYADGSRSIYGILCVGPRAKEWHGRGLDIRTA